MIWHMPPAALLPFLGIVPICRDLLVGVMIRVALLYYSLYRFKNLEDMPNDVIQRFIWIYSSQWSNPRNYYKLNILCHIYYQPCKTAQRSEENCIVIPAFRHLFSTWLFWVSIHSCWYTDMIYSICVSLSFCTSWCVVSTGIYSISCVSQGFDELCFRAA